MSDSESGSDLSDIEASPSRRFNPIARRSRLSNASNNTNNDSDSDSDDSILGGLNRLQRKRKSREEKDEAGSDSDSDIDIVDDVKKGVIPSKPTISSKPILNLDDSDDSDNERSTRYKMRISDIPMSEALLKARRAREALAADDTIDLDDDDDDDDEVLDVPPAAAQKAPTEPVQYVKIDTRIKNGDPSKTHAYQLKINDPFEKLMEVYRERQGYSKFRRIFLEYNGNKIDLEKTPKDFGFQQSQSYLIDIQDEEQRLNQVRVMQNQEASSSGVESDRIIGEAGGIPLKIRRNGCKNSIDTFRILPTSRFQTLMNFFYQKYGVTENDCKFEFDGCPLESQATPDGEDCEGDEVIDVKVDEAALAKGKKNAVAPVQAPPIIASTTRTASSVKSVPLVQAPMGGNGSTSRQSSTANDITSATEPSESTQREPLAIFVVRNNKAPKPKKFKLLPTDKVIKLKQGYINHYKKKGCRSVKFYLRGSPIEDEGVITFETLNILPTERVIAMENGRKC